MSKLLISVVIPVFNMERYVEETLLSVLGQEGAEFEIIAINDGSTDRSTEILRRYANRIILVEQENQGLQLVRNAGIQKAQGELIAFLDADDLYLPGHLKAMARFEKEHPEAIGFYGDVQAIDSKGRNLWVQPSPAAVTIAGLVTGNSLTHSSVMMRRTWFDRGELYHPRGPAADWEMWLRALEAGPLVHYPWIGVAYRKHAASAIHQDQQTAEDVTFQLLDWVFSRHPELDERVRNQALANAYYESMVRFLAAGKGREARPRAIACLRREPTKFKALTGLMLSAAPKPMIEAAISLRRQIKKWLA